MCKKYSKASKDYFEDCYQVYTNMTSVVEYHKIYKNTKLRWILPKSGQERKLWCFLKWRNAEVTKIELIFTKERNIKIEVS